MTSTYVPTDWPAHGYGLLLSQWPGMNRARWHAVLDHPTQTPPTDLSTWCHNPAGTWHTTLFRRLQGSRHLTNDLPKHPPPALVERVQRQLDWLEQQPNHHALVWNDAAFPEPLRHVPDRPLVLWVRGNRRLLQPNGGVAVVGCRDATTQGNAMTRTWAACLASHGLTIVSGLARGIDGQAHRGCLDVEGHTVAVLGHGLQHLYPANHRDLADHIVATNGSLVSDYPPEQRPQRHHFPERNRLISGLSRAVLLMEAKAHSGSMSTVRHALDQGRDVHAVPGHPSSLHHERCLALIQAGAGCATHPHDLLHALGIQPHTTSSLPTPTQPLAASVDAALCSTTPQTFDDVLRQLPDAPPNAVHAALAELLTLGRALRTLNGYVRTTTDPIAPKQP